MKDTTRLPSVAQSRFASREDALEGVLPFVAALIIVAAICVMGAVG